MRSDIEIAQEAKPKHILDIAKEAGIDKKYLKLYGDSIAKVSLDIMGTRPAKGKLVLVTAMTPTPSGEGKTTISIGLTQALRKKGKDAIVCIREPSLGPCFGVKGGAAGGGYSQVLPMEDINLHFTGDIHAMSAAHNLLSAMVDNHIHYNKEPRIDPRKVTWRRVVDINDRALRNIVIGLGGSANGVPRESGYDITVASEVMAIMCLASGISDLKERLGRIIVGYTFDDKQVYASDIKAHGSMAALLKDALMPNLVQTLEGGPALVHCGPFANIAHGCSSLTATRLGLQLADIVVTEAGFGSDLGAEKFLDIKCRIGNLKPDAVVIVATMKALRYHGGSEDYSKPDLKAVRKGIDNLKKHIENVSGYGLAAVVVLNHFTDDSEDEIRFVSDEVKKSGAEFATAKVWAKGGEGGIELAEKVIKKIEGDSRFRFLYDEKESIKDKITSIATGIYGASGVEFTAKAKKDMKQIEAIGLDKVPVCIAKTPVSLSDDPKIRGRPEGFTVTIREVQISNGAGFLVALAGDIMKMPGLPRKPAAEGIDVSDDGRITGLF